MPATDKNGITLTLTSEEKDVTVTPVPVSVALKDSMGYDATTAAEVKSIVVTFDRAVTGTASVSKNGTIEVGSSELSKDGLTLTIPVSKAPVDKDTVTIADLTAKDDGAALANNTLTFTVNTGVSVALSKV